MGYTPQKNAKKKEPLRLRMKLKYAGFKNYLIERPTISIAKKLNTQPKKQPH
jgi:hypothetical protein